jgi:hypothetical protein
MQAMAALLKRGRYADEIMNRQQEDEKEAKR